MRKKFEVFALLIVTICIIWAYGNAKAGSLLTRVKCMPASNVIKGKSLCQRLRICSQLYKSGKPKGNLRNHFLLMYKSEHKTSLSYGQYVNYAYTTDRTKLHLKEIVLEE
jgi:hypothetical protein